MSPQKLTLQPPAGISAREAKAWRLGFADGLSHEQAKCKCRSCGRPRYWDDVPCEKCRASTAPKDEA